MKSLKSMMKKKVLINYSCRFFIVSLLFFTSLLTTSFLQAIVNWHDSVVNISVTDDNIDIMGTNTLQKTIIVSALTTDINISISNDSVITGTIFDNTPSQLQLRVANGHTINFDLSNHLTFKGADGSGKEGDLLITIDGDGQVVFDLGDGKTALFTAYQNSAGTQMYVMMDEPIIPTLLFKRKNTNSDSHVQVEIGQRSLISYLSQVSLNLDKGLIIFDPANDISKKGRMLLKICNTGGIYIGGNRVTDRSAPSLDTIFLDQLAGLEARLLIRNQTVNGDSSLLVENQNQTYPDLFSDPFEKNDFDGRRYGFILGANGTIRVDDDSYLDYVGLANNFCPCLDICPDILCERDIWSFIKSRNGSAFIVDSDPDLDFKAKVELGASSAIYFRSGIDKCGEINEIATDGVFSFTVDNAKKTSGAGEIVFDVEGWLDVVGDGNGAINALQVLSLEVTITGGSVLIDSSETIFPKRTFAKDSSLEYVSYNSASWFINNKINLYNTWLVHTDQNHRVCENNDIISEPTYVGGEKIKTCYDPCILPKISFYNSQMYLHTSAAFTGLDLFVPNLDEENGNDSIFKFFNNGAEIDDGSGRNLILGTCIGACSCSCVLVSSDAHLDVFQDSNQTWTAQHNLSLRVGMNNDTIIENVPDDPTCEVMAAHTIYLGHTSNISIGGDILASGIDTMPTFSILGNFFSFETRGGNSCSPENSGTTGQGGIFVDKNGSFLIGDQYRANISAMVVKSDNGFVYLPKGKVFFDKKVGITDWNLDLSENNIIIPPDTFYCDYTLNWLSTKKDYENFCPYQICCVGLCGNCPPVTTENITSLPTIQGYVDQFQVKGSRLSNPASFMVDGGHIREVVFLTDCNSAEAPTAFIVVQNEGIVGLGSRHKNTDSLDSSIFLGVNGVTIIANDYGTVTINEDIIINDICHILKGPDFESGVIRFTSDCGKKLRVQNGGVLDLSSFTEVDQIVEFGGSLELILEPGSRIKLNGGTLSFADHAKIVCTSISDITIFFDPENDITITDNIRVDFIGRGTVEFNECSTMDILKWAYVGVTSDDECAEGNTDITFWLKDKSIVTIGGACPEEGGVLQIGDTKISETNTVNFYLLIDGPDALFKIGSHSFFGLNVGIVDNTYELPNFWLVDHLFNVNSIAINVKNGTFSHNKIFSDDNYEASLMAVGNYDTSAKTYTFNFTKDPEVDEGNSRILGGGNIARVDTRGTPVEAPVGSDLTDNANLMSSKNLIYDNTAIVDNVFGFIPQYYDFYGTLPTDKESFTSPATGAQFFTYIGMADLYSTPFGSGIFYLLNPFTPTKTIIYSAAGTGDKGVARIGYVDSTEIFRFSTEFIRGPRNIVTDHAHTFRLGAAKLTFLLGDDGIRRLFEVAEMY